MRHLSKTLYLKASIVALAIVAFLPLLGVSQSPAIVQPGAPGEPTKVLPSTTRAVLPPTSKQDIDFMKGMIMHHRQAVEMTDMIDARTKNKDIHLLGERIARSQMDEMNFMTRWLELRGETAEMSHHGNHGDKKLMPGMLTAMQMGALKRAKGKEFDRLFLQGMIQHHKGALIMVKELFDSPGAGQDAELFNFASDVDSGQRAEIRSMETLLDKQP